MSKIGLLERYWRTTRYFEDLAKHAKEQAALLVEAQSSCLDEKDQDGKVDLSMDTSVPFFLFEHCMALGNIFLFFCLFVCLCFRCSWKS